MTVVFIVPTGIGAEIGGHAGDATPAARLIASVCDRLITHPNVVNASDINEMTDNMLYVEGSILDRFLEGKIELQSVRANRVLVAVNAPVRAETVNAVSAARATLGVEVSIVELKHELELYATVGEHQAGGQVHGVEELIAQVRQYDFDALAVATPITISREVAMHYLENGGINPWGGVEAIVSRQIAEALDKPVAHAPIENGSVEDFNEVADPRMAAELVSICYLHCVLKGLHRAPRIGHGLSVRDVEAMITPVGCFGRPHCACLDAGIPVIAVRENRTRAGKPDCDQFIYVENYLEAAGHIVAFRTGVSVSAIRRPLMPTVVGHE